MNKIFKRIMADRNASIPDIPSRFENPEDSENTGFLESQSWEEVYDVANRNIKLISSQLQQIKQMVNKNEDPEKISMTVSDIIEQLYDVTDVFINYNNSLSTF